MRSRRSRIVTPLEAFLAISGALSFVVGGLLLSAGERLVGTLLISWPLIFAAISIFRTPPGKLESEWKTITKRIAELEREQERRPGSGPYWKLFHALDGVFAIVSAVLLAVFGAYFLWAWIASE